MIAVLVAMSHSTSSAVTLGTTPLLHLLASAADREVTGTLTFEAPDHAQAMVVFERGAPKKAAATAPRCKLSELLIELGWLDTPLAERTYREAVERSEPHGQVLLDRELLDPGSLLQVLFYQFVRKLDWVATRAPETLVVMHEGEDLLAKTPALPEDVSPLAVLWGMAKGHVDVSHKRELLQHVSHRPIRLHPQSLPDLFGFNDAEMALVERLRHPAMDLASLLYHVQLPRMTAEALIYVLLLTRHIDLGDGRLPIGLASSATVAALRISGAPPPRRTRIAGRREAAPTHRNTCPSQPRRINHSLSSHLLRRAEQLLRRDRLLLAEAEAQRARELDPDNPNCVAVCLWIQSLLTTSFAELDRLLLEITQTLERDPMNVPIRFYRSQLLKRTDRVDEAAEEWQRITELEPTHIDALRELRLWQMRRASCGEPKKLKSGVREQVSFVPPSAGLFGRLFRSAR